MRENNTSTAHFVNNARDISAPCLFLCLVLVAIIGFLPIIPGRITQLLRPGAILFCVLFQRKQQYPLSSASRSLLIYLGYLGIIFLSHDITNSAFSFFFSMILFGLFFLFETQRVWNGREISAIIKTVVFASFLCAAVLLSSNEDLRSFNVVGGLEFFGSVKNRNSMAFSLVPGTICSFLVFLNIKRSILSPIRLIYLLVFFTCMYSIVGTGARSASLSMIVGVLFVLWDKSKVGGDKKKSFANHIFLLIVSAVFILILLKLTSGTDSARLFENVDNLSGREELWDFARQLIHEKPIFGGGFDYWNNMNGDKLGTHNTFLTIMVISGYVGAVFLSIFFVSVLLELSSAKSLVPMAFIAEVAAHTISESSLDYYAYIPLILAYILFRYYSCSKRELSSIF